jgi:aspartate racemase
MSVRRTVGVLGGMGPASTAEFYRLLVETTAADSDQQHLHVIIDGDAGIPDRRAALVGVGEDPRPRMIQSARRLEAAGAQIVAMPCNTAHAFLSDVQSAISVPVIDMIAETAEAALQVGGRASAIGIMATDAALSTGLYPLALTTRGVVPVLPDIAAQERLMAAIWHVKAGRNDAAGHIVARGATQLAIGGCAAVLLGCSELPIAVKGLTLPVPVVDSLATLARATIERAGATTKTG